MNGRTVMGNMSCPFIDKGAERPKLALVFLNYLKRYRDVT